MSPTAKETVAVEEDVTYAPAPHVSAAYGSGTPGETDFADLSTPAPVDPVAPAADAGVDVEVDVVDTDADGTWLVCPIQDMFSSTRRSK